MKKAIKIVATIAIIIFIILTYHAIVTQKKEVEITEISSEQELKEIYGGKEQSIFSQLTTLPFSLIIKERVYYNDTIYNVMEDSSVVTNGIKRNNNRCYY